ncbi:MAG: transhydrogenase subunit alpha [Chthoniobacteraceae bacterium]|nr:transhydrogenase subunit alpha [Chthoniobacteraceae bacterium]
MRKKLAIIGTGISGLGCAHFLHKEFDLTLYEQNDYAGGHANTIIVPEQERLIPIDTGFMVYNETTYPNLTRLFRELNVETKPTDMSFSVQYRPANLEYNGSSLGLLFGQRRNLWNLRFWRMLMNINRFNSEAVATLEDPRFSDCTLREYITKRGYGEDMLHRYLVPMGGAVWSTPPDLMLEFPARTLLRFWHNHGFLGLHTQHPWRTVTDGARSYVQKMTLPFKERIHLGRRAVRIIRGTNRVIIEDSRGNKEEFDKLIMACHGDQSLALLAEPTATEVRLLSKFKYQRNSATVHTDSSVMPHTRRCWASWNYRVEKAEDGRLLPTTHYWMNRLQGVSERENYFVSLNAANRIAPDSVLREIEYEHPLFDLAAVAAQSELPALNHQNQTTYFCGAWFKYGFHEDGFTSALECARSLTREPIWGS